MQNNRSIVMEHSSFLCVIRKFTVFFVKIEQ